jgi:hypothetical protein
VFFVTLIVSQWGHLLSVRRKSPYFYQSILDTEKQGGWMIVRIWRELLSSPPRAPLVIAIILSALTANFFNEIPALQTACGTGSVPSKYWGIAIGFSVGIFFVAEIRKWIILTFPNSIIVKRVLLAW